MAPIFSKMNRIVSDLVHVGIIISFSRIRDFVIGNNLSFARIEVERNRG
jgi:hypothetical protein